MYNVSNVVGDFFEELLMGLFDSIRTDSTLSGEFPDLISRDGSFYMEVKSGSYLNCAIIKEKQLRKFNNLAMKRFYDVAYHSLKNMSGNYPTEDELRANLDLKSLFVFPISIINAHFEMSSKNDHPSGDTFVRLRESMAYKIFGLDEKVWEELKINPDDYKTVNLHEKVHIMTRGGHLEQEILNSFRPEFLI